MRVVKLALRSALSLRSSLIPAAIVLLGGGFVMTLAGAVFTPIRAAEREAVAWAAEVRAFPGFVEDARGALPGPAVLVEALEPQEAEAYRLALGIGDQESASTTGSGTVVVVLPEPGASPDRLTRSVVQSTAGGRELQFSASLRRVEWIMGAILTLFSVATMVPAVALVTRRLGPSFRTMHEWGIPARTTRRLIILTGAFGAALGAALGSAGALILAAVLETAGRSVMSMIPDGLLEISDTFGRPASILANRYLLSLLERGTVVVTPEVGYFASIVAVSTLLGALTALPSLPFAATLRVRRLIWHW